MLCYAIYPTLLPQLQREWGASNSAAGLISGMFFAGYMASVPVLSGLTDRVDARRVYFCSSLLVACGCLGFALFAQGVWSAAAFQALTGAGIAGTYMPGLRALTDNLGERAQSRAVSFYTAVFGFGASLSILLAGAIAASLGWRWAFGLCALGPLAAGLMVLTGFCMYTTTSPNGWMYGAFYWATHAMGGLQNVRLIHHITTWFFVMFVPVHIYLAMRADVIERGGGISQMINGGKFVPRNEEFADGDD